jgi:hypothetical protein
MVGIFSTFIIAIGGNSPARMAKLRRWSGTIILCMIFLALFVNCAYRYAVLAGVMDISEEVKYNKQTKEGTAGIISFLVAGRGVTFIGLYALMGSPVIGLGSNALDFKGYQFEFIGKYGNASDYDELLGRLGNGDESIPTHSHIVSAWLWHGIGGAIFWGYVCWILFTMLKSNMGVIPDWYGYLALAIPAAIWNILFSPFGSRVQMSALILVCLLARAVTRRKLNAPPLERGDLRI